MDGGECSFVAMAQTELIRRARFFFCALDGTSEMQESTTIRSSGNARSEVLN